MGFSKLIEVVGLITEKSKTNKHTFLPSLTTHISSRCFLAESLSRYLSHFRQAMPDFPISGLKAKLTNSKIWSQSRLVARDTFILGIGSPKGIFSGSLGLRGFEARSYGREAQNTSILSWGQRFKYSCRVSRVVKAELL